MVEALGWDVISHPSYSPDSVPSEYYLFALPGHFFHSFEKTKKWIDSWTAMLTTLTSILLLFKHTDQSIELKVRSMFSSLMLKKLNIRTLFEMVLCWTKYKKTITLRNNKLISSFCLIIES